MSKFSEKNQLEDVQYSKRKFNTDKQEEKYSWLLNLETISKNEATEVNGGLSFRWGGEPNTVSTNLPTDYTKANNLIKDSDSSNNCFKNKNSGSKSDWLIELKTINDNDATQVAGGGFLGSGSSRNTGSSKLPCKYNIIAQLTSTESK